MPNYLRPGTYINEAPMTNPSIQPANSNTTAFYGITQRGPANVAVKVFSWQDYINKYAFGLPSAFYASGYNGYAVYGFFNNGGTTMYQTRVTGSSAAAASFTFTDTAGTPASILKFTASFTMPDSSTIDDPGTWGNNIAINITANGSNWDVAVKYNGVVVETFKNCSLTVGNIQFIEAIINTFSNYIRVQRLGAGTAINGTMVGVDKSLAGGVDALPATADFQNNLPTMDSYQGDFSLIVCPDCQVSAFIQSAYAKAALWNAYLITDGALTDTVASIQTLRSGLNSDFAALYYPWIQIYDPIATNRLQPNKYIPAAGHIAGNYAATDRTRGTHKAPAGTVDGVITGALATKTQLSITDEDTLNSNQINIVKPIKNVGVTIWGARGLSTGLTMYVPVRRELSKIERSIREGTRWAVFEPSNQATWSKITNGIRAFLFREMEAGAFAGVNPDGSDSFFVVCDSTNNGPQDVNQGIINIQVGVAQVRPGEFIVINIGQIQ